MTGTETERNLNMALTDEQWAKLHEESTERKRIATGSGALEEIRTSLRPFADEAEKARDEFLKLRPAGEKLLANMEKVRPFKSVNLMLNRQLEGVYASLRLGVRLDGNFDEVGRYIATLSKTIIRDTQGSPAAVAAAKVKSCWQQIGKLKSDMAEANAFLEQYESRPRYGVPPPSPFEARPGTPPPNTDTQHAVKANVEENSRG
jgi:hypothetical protein